MRNEAFFKGTEKFRFVLFTSWQKFRRISGDFGSATSMEERKDADEAFSLERHPKSQLYLRGVVPRGETGIGQFVELHGRRDRRPPGRPGVAADVDLLRHVVGVETAVQLHAVGIGHGLVERRVRVGPLGQLTDLRRRQMMVRRHSAVLHRPFRGVVPALAALRLRLRCRAGMPLTAAPRRRVAVRGQNLQMVQCVLKTDQSINQLIHQSVNRPNLSIEAINRRVRRVRKTATVFLEKIEMQNLRNDRIIPLLRADRSPGWPLRWRRGESGHANTAETADSTAEDSDCHGESDSAKSSGAEMDVAVVGGLAFGRPPNAGKQENKYNKVRLAA